MLPAAEWQQEARAEFLATLLYICILTTAVAGLQLPQQLQRAAYRVSKALLSPDHRCILSQDLWVDHHRRFVTFRVTLVFGLAIGIWL